MSTTRHRTDTCPFDAVVVVGSFGAFRSFRTTLECLPAEFPAALILDLHRRDPFDLTAQLLAHHSNLPIRVAEGGLALEPSNVYLAPHDQQLLITSDQGLRVLGSAGGFGHRTADALLISAAEVFASRLIAVVLSGRLDGGARGVREVKHNGGRVMVEDPDTAAAPSMPTAALATGCVDLVLSPELLGRALLVLCAATGAAELFRVRPNTAVSS